MSDEGWYTDAETERLRQLFGESLADKPQQPVSNSVSLIGLSRDIWTTEVFKAHQARQYAALQDAAVLGRGVYRGPAQAPDPQLPLPLTERPNLELAPPPGTVLPPEPESLLSLLIRFIFRRPRRTS